MNSKTISVRKHILYLFGLLVLALPAHAASFDCAKAATKVEKIICSDAEISKLDEELNAAYKTALQDEKQADSIKQAQKQWVKERNSCADAACVKGAYQKRIGQLHAAQTLSITNITQEMNKAPRLTAGWGYKQEGLRSDSPYGVGEDDEMCQQVLAYMNREAPNWVPYDVKTWGTMQNFCTTTVRLFPGFTEPPWTELNPRQHEALIAKLLQYREQGARAYFGYARVPLQRRKGFFEEEARRFIEAGGRLQYWKTRLVDFTPDPKDMVDKHWPPGDQHVIQLRTAVDYSNSTMKDQYQNLTCRLPAWRGSVFLVTDDLSGPNPRILDGGGGALSNSALFIYGGKPVLINDSGYEIHIDKYRDEQNFLRTCILTYPHYKFKQRN